jgi:hypothetical protein
MAARSTGLTASLPVLCAESAPIATTPCCSRRRTAHRMRFQIGDQRGPLNCRCHCHECNPHLANGGRLADGDAHIVGGRGLGSKASTFGRSQSTSTSRGAIRHHENNHGVRPFRVPTLLLAGAGARSCHLCRTDPEARTKIRRSIVAGANGGAGRHFRVTERTRPEAGRA